LNALVSDFEISPTFVLQSGLPFSLSVSCGAILPGDAPCQPNGDAKNLPTKVNGIPGVGVTYFTPISGTNTHGFSTPALDTIGTVKRNTAWGPGFFNSDISLSKGITFAERYTATFRLDAYNAFNHINLGNPNGNILNGGGIGSGPYPTSTGGTTNPRQLQFTAHFTF
jgi:hypothetical protein